VKFARPCRIIAWLTSFVLTLALFQLLAGVHPRSVPWIVLVLGLSAVIGAALLSSFEWLCVRFLQRRCSDD
jgi:hypothetical protein